MNKWMEYCDEIHNKPINKIVLPATHNSGAYNINFNINYQNKWLKLSNSLGKRISFIENIIQSWTLTQKKNIYQQLMSGIRLFDFRVSYYENEYYISHTYFCVKLNEVLGDIRKFMDENTGEIIILQFSNDWEHRYEMDMKKNNEVASKIFRKLQPLISYPSAFKTYNEMVNTNQRIIVFYNISNINNFNYLWSIKHYYDPWDNTDDVEEKIQMLKDDFDKMTDDRINFISLTLTPQSKTVIKSVIKKILLPCSKAKNIKYLSKEIQNEFKNIIKENKDKIHLLSGIKMDYPSKDLIKDIINLNS